MLEQLKALNLDILNITSILDIILVTFVFYRFMRIIQGTRAVQLIKGLVVLLVANTVSSWLHLYTINWLLQQVMTALVVALPIVFQPELRRALETLGRGKFFAKTISTIKEADRTRMINEVVRAVQVLTKNKMGALIIIERQTGLEEYIDSGVKIDGIVSAEFMINIFIPNTPLHDGAVIIRGDRVVAAASFLPLSENPYLSKELGTRHRAGIGVTEVSDALAVIVSEETGDISLASDGNLDRMLDEPTLKKKLTEALEPKTLNSLGGVFRRNEP
ncbi:diadenylate cyclase CdaA [Desulforamulus aquiferis]|uniref:Diadenylate cyclase n=1 Tax=Desulforamulus aquiferis TaxID=1397668 RepID=A0AAW7ZAP8_9FIRM|nr:diadenylate cyclase CdaA [Desulforamulus aquiferis]MDO7786560.1 diadenylate cyclase CdaA [Desulforamulus aquiferis]